MTETNYNTPIFNDPAHCDNEDCIDGFIKEDFWDYDHNVFLAKKVKCKYCDDLGHKI